MTKHLLKDLLDQNLKTCSYTFKEIDQKNSTLRLNDDTASVGFIYRHIGEIMHLISQFFGIPTSVQNTTIGHILYHNSYHCGQITLALKRGR